MGDGSGMRDGGFKISTHGFTLKDNLLLFSVLMENYGIKATIHKDRGYNHLYILKD